MGRKDMITKEYMSEQNPSEFGIFKKRKELEIVQKERDILKQCVLMEDKRYSYLLLGIENQTNVHYALPVKAMIYDALNYGKQVSEKAKQHRKKNIPIEEGIDVLIATLQELGQNSDFIIHTIMEKFSVSEEEAREYMKS